MPTGSEDRDADLPKHDDGKHDDAPEAAALLGSPLSAPRDGVANAEAGAASSSPLLVRPDGESNRGEMADKSKRKKKKKARDLSSPAAVRTKPRKKKRDSADPSHHLSSRMKRESTVEQDQANHREVPKQTPTSWSLWGMLSRCVCIGGSMRSPTSSTELPQLNPVARTKLKSLDKIAKKTHMEIFVRRTDNMPFSGGNISTYGHPIVVIHILDSCTGLPLTTRRHTGPAKFSSRMLNAFEWNSSQTCRNLTLPEFLAPHVLVLLEILEPRRRRGQSRDQQSKQTGKSASATTTTTTNDDLDHDLSSEVFYKRIAWCFFKPISERGNIRLPSLLLPDEDSARAAPLRLQLFTWYPLSWLDSQHARAQFQWNPDSGEGVPTVFLQHQRRTTTPIPCSIHIEIRPIASTQSPKHLPNVPDGVASPASKNEEDTTSNQHETSSHANTPQTSEHAMADTKTPETLLHCKRSIGEPCMVPQRVLYRLPTGRKGCTCLAFSPDGLFLAAAVHHVTSTADEWVIHIHEINTGALWQCCRGHQSMIYSLEWGLVADGTTKALVSASSDGSAILWYLRATTGITDRGNAPTVMPSQTFQHVPSPVFVYCAVFHTTQSQLIVSGASDGVIRLWDGRPTSTGTTTKTSRQYSSAPIHEWSICSRGQCIAIHSIRMETKQNGRLFCGDASGTITVWAPSATGPLRYELSKTVRTGQRSVASLALHPRKQHLLVLTHPHVLFQYETRSFLLLHKSYSGIECDQLLAKAAFSPDGQYVVSGSEDGVPHLFGAVEGVRLAGASSGLWGHRFFHGFPLMEIAWSPTAHIVAMGAYGETHPIVVLCANREDRPLQEVTVSKIQKQHSISEPRHPGYPGLTGLEKTMKDVNPVESTSRSVSNDATHLRNPVAQVTDRQAAESLERARQRQQQRVQAKLAREIEAADLQPSL